MLRYAMGINGWAVKMPHQNVATERLRASSELRTVTIHMGKGDDYVTCAATDPGAEPDLGRLAEEAVWDAEQKKYISGDGNKVTAKMDE